MNVRNEMRYLLERNFSSWLMCLFFFAFILMDNSFEKKARRIFGTICITTLALSIFECADYTLAQRMYPVFARQLITTMIQSLRIFIVFYMSRAVDRDSDFNPKLALPFFGYLVLMLINIPSGIVFSFNDVNQFTWGPFSVVTLLIFAFYFIVMIAFTIKYTGSSEKNEQIIVMFVIVGSVISMFVEAMMSIKFLLNSTMIVCAVMYYLFLHTHIYKRDELTKLYNRRNFYLDAEDLQKRENFIIVSIDLNNLKYINDTFGHKEGDKAITAIVKELNRHMKSGCNLYRVGGDEFMMICRKMKYQDVEKMLDDVDICLDYTPYSIAYGMAIYTLDSDFEKVLNIADEKMYENKRIKKELEKSGNKKKPVITANIIEK